MKKTIATKQIKRWQKLDRLVFLVPIFVFFFLSIGEAGRQLWGIVMKERDIGVTAAAFTLLAFSTVVASLPILFIWRAISHTVRKTAIRNATFRTDEDFDYYREKLTGIPPVTISLLMDLQIETKKDVAALLLYYVKIGAVSMEDGKICVLNDNMPGLMPSDRTLLALIAQGQVPAGLGKWKEQVIAEAVSSGNLKRRGIGQNMNSVSRSCLTGCFSGCLMPSLLFLGMGIAAVQIEKSGWLDKAEGFLSQAPQSFGIEQMNYLLSSPDMVIGIALSAFFVISFLAILLLPVSAVLRMILSASKEILWLKRTDRGELLTAQISGLKNFLHDFSNLSEAEKEQLILWDDFLIYAVVLEENERIIEDIFRMKNLRYRDYILF